MKAKITAIDEKNSKKCLEIADQELGKGYLHYDDLIDENNYGISVEFNKNNIGFALGKILPMENLKSNEKFILNLKPYIKNFDKLTKINYISNIAVKKQFHNKGIGSKLFKNIFNYYIKNNYPIIFLAWKPSHVDTSKLPINNISIKLGFKEYLTINQFWAEDSIKNEYLCPVCGLPPCQCSAVLYLYEK